MDKILVFGDSIAYGKWDTEGGWVARLRKYIDGKYNIDHEGNLQVFNLGIPGEVTVRMANRVKEELIMRATNLEDKVLVIFAIGINDSCPNNWMTNKQTPETEFKQALKQMAKIALESKCRVAFIGLTPVNPARSKGLKFTDNEVSKYDNYISQTCEELRIPKLELFENLKLSGFPKLLVDSVHPNSEGHQILFQKVKEFLESTWKI